MSKASSAARLWGHVNGEPYLVNSPALAIWGNRPRRKRRVLAMRTRRRSGRARGRSRRRARVVMVQANRPRRRHHHGRRRHHRALVMNPNPPRHRARRRSRGAFGGGGGGFDPMRLLPGVALGVGAGVGLGYVMPMVSAQLNLAPVGMMFRLAQAGVILGAGWAANNFRALAPHNVNAFMTTGLAIVGLGLVADWQRGLLMPAPVSAAASPPHAGMEGMGYYRPALRGAPYGTSRGSLGYYATVRP